MSLNTSRSIVAAHLQCIAYFPPCTCGKIFVFLECFHFVSLPQEDQSHGEIVLDLEGGKIFSVAQHQNDPNLNFLCLESKRVELYHRGVYFHVVIKHLRQHNFLPSFPFLIILK